MPLVRLIQDKLLGKVLNIVVVLVCVVQWWRARVDQNWCDRFRLARRICHRCSVGRRCQQLTKTVVGYICGLDETFRGNENKDPRFVAFEVLPVIVG